MILGAEERGRAFPWGGLPSIRRAEATDARALRLWGASNVRLDAVQGVLSDLLGCDVRIALRATWRGGVGAPLARGVRVVLERADGGPDSRWALEVEGALAVAAVTRALRRPAPKVIDDTKPVSEEIAGALAAILSAALRRAHATGSAWQIVEAGAPASTALEGEEVLAASWTVSLQGETFVARVRVPRALVREAARAPWSADHLRALGDIRLAIPVVACVSAWTVAELATLAPGDVFCPGEWPLAKGAGGATWGGPVALAPAALEHGVRAALGDGGRLVLLGGVESFVPAEGRGDGRGAGMDERATDDALIEAIGEVPVTVRVEVGTAEMPARDWAALGQGDVITLGTRVADPVTLRVGTRVVARGELVDIEGEVGVRIVERLDRKRGSL